MKREEIEEALRQSKQRALVHSQIEDGHEEPPFEQLSGIDEAMREEARRRREAFQDRRAWNPLARRS
jgi:hypothetical protein